MKKIIIILFVLFIQVTDSFSTDNIIADKKMIKKHIEYLSGIKPARTWDNVKSLNQAADYIAKQFRNNTKDAKFQEYSVKGKKYKNVIASFGIMNKTRIILGAHYDVCTPVPGADDNGSGVAAIIELSRMLKLSDLAKLKFRIDLIAYSLEEPPFFGSSNMGSAVHASFLKSRDESVYLMISVDMIGYFAQETKPHDYIKPYIDPNELERGNMTALIGTKNEQKIMNKMVKLMQDHSKVKILGFKVKLNMPGVDWSDHRNYWKNGYRALFLSNYFLCPSPYYHSKNDVISFVDCTKIASITTGLFYAVINL